LQYNSAKKDYDDDDDDEDAASQVSLAIED